MRKQNGRMPLLVGLLWLATLGCGRRSNEDGTPSTEGLHKDCSSSVCATGQVCMTYHNLAGLPQSTCEIPCDTHADCPSGLSCFHISEGPSSKICT